MMMGSPDQLEFEVRHGTLRVIARPSLGLRINLRLPHTQTIKSPALGSLVSWIRCWTRSGFMHSLRLICNLTGQLPSRDQALH
jgi:hypothetical protein